MDPDPRLQQILEYIRDNHQRYTRDAIRAQLVAAGHDPQQVDAAWERELGAAEGGRPGGGLAGFALVLLLLGGLIGGLGALALTSSFFGSFSAPIFFVGYAVSYVGLGYVVYRVVRWGVARFWIRGLWALLLGIALIPVYAALMFGTCVAAYNLARGG